MTVTLFKEGLPVRTINGVIDIVANEEQVYTDFITKVGSGETASNQINRSDYDFFVVAG